MIINELKNRYPKSPLYVIIQGAFLDGYPDLDIEKKADFSLEDTFFLQIYLLSFSHKYAIIMLYLCLLLCTCYGRRRCLLSNVYDNKMISDETLAKLRMDSRILEYIDQLSGRKNNM